MSSVEVKEIGPCKQQFLIQLDENEVGSAWEKGLQEVTTTVSLPGFRKGKVPKKIIEKRFSKELEDQVKQDLVVEHFEKAVKDNDFVPLGDPAIDDVEFSRETGLSFSATVEIRPEFEVKDYKGIALERSPVEVGTEEVDKIFEDLRKQRAFLKPSETPSKEGDHLTGTVEFLVKDAVIHTVEHGHLHAGHDHLHQMTLPGFGSKLINLSSGDEMTHEVTLDDSFPLEDHRGTEAVVRLKVEEVKVEEIPELDEQFFKNFGVEDAETLKERIREDIENTKKNEIEEAMAETMLNKIAETLSLPIPEDLLKNQCLNLVRQDSFAYQLAQAPKDQQEKLLNDEMEKVKDVAQTQVRNFFILEKIAEKEKIFVTEKEMAQRIAQMAMSRGEAPEKLMEELRKTRALSEIRLGLRERKTVEWLISKADVSEIGPDAKKKETKKSKKEKKSDA